MDNNPVEDAVAYIRRFADLAERLAKKNIVVRRIDCSWGSFGSFIVEVTDGDEETKRASAIQRGAYSESGPDIYRALWDGKERDLTFGSMRSTATTIFGPSRAIESRSPTSYIEAIESAFEWLADRIGSSRRL
jgi:hypothetical protein